MGQPLVTRPAYGQGRPATPVAVSALPSGPPAGKGIGLSPDLPGASTFKKPEDDIRQQGKDDESIHRVDNADDLTKDRSRVDTVEDNANKHDSIGYNGKGENVSPKTKYPYRDGVPNSHSASARYVLACYLSQCAPEQPVDLSDPVRVAATIAQVTENLSPKVQERATKCTSTVKRVDTKNLRWIFSVDCGNGPKVVRLKASRKSPKVVKLTKMDVAFTCSCNAWQWLGPEHNAQQGGYLDGKPRGTASSPDIKDPPRKNKVCKHVACVIGLIRGWEVKPSKAKQASDENEDCT